MRKQTLSVQDVDGGKLFYINGSLQFDTRDEGIYHEFLAAASSLIAAARTNSPLNALILGGGDGLALREVLSHAAAKSVCLVDHDREVINIAMDDFSPWNKRSLFDPRARILIDDARSFLGITKDIFDLIIADFTYPDTIDGASLYARDFFSLVRRHLTGKGVFATNALSPANTPRAFRSLIKTLRAAGISPLPVAANIPSFLNCGYGTWGFLIGSPKRISRAEISNLKFPDSLRYLNKSSLRSAIKTLGRENLISAAFSRPVICPSDLISLLSMEFDLKDNYPDWSRKMALVLNQIDWPALLKEIENYFWDLPKTFRDELLDLKTRCDGFFSLNKAYKVLLFLVLVLTFINAVNPDNAYAKGSHGYHGFSSGSGTGANFSWFAAVTPTAFRFQNMLPAFSIGAWNVSGASKPKRAITVASGGISKQEVLNLNLTENIYISESGQVFIFIYDTPYAYKADAGGLTILKPTGEAVWKFPMDADIYRAITSNISNQKKALLIAISEYETWMNWAGIVYDTVARNSREARELDTLKKLKIVFEQLEANFPSSNTPASRPALMQKLSPGIFATEKGEIHIQQADGSARKYITDSGKIYDVNGILPSKDWDAILISLLEGIQKTMQPGAPNFDAYAQLIKNLKGRN